MNDTNICMSNPIQSCVIIKCVVCLSVSCNLFFYHIKILGAMFCVRDVGKAENHTQKTLKLKVCWLVYGMDYYGRWETLLERLNMIVSLHLYRKMKIHTFARIKRIERNRKIKRVMWCYVACLISLYSLL